MAYLYPRCWSSGRTILHSIDCETLQIVDRENSSFLVYEAEYAWTTKLGPDWAILLEQPVNCHRRDTQHFNIREQTQNISIHLQEQTQNICIQTVFPGQIEKFYQLHERPCDGLAIKKRYINVLCITLHGGHFENEVFRSKL